MLPVLSDKKNVLTVHNKYDECCHVNYLIEMTTYYLLKTAKNDLTSHFMSSHFIKVLRNSDVVHSIRVNVVLFILLESIFDPSHQNLPVVSKYVN